MDDKKVLWDKNDCEKLEICSAFGNSFIYHVMGWYFKEKANLKKKWLKFYGFLCF